MDGPVVGAARKALDAGDASIILPWVHRQGEAEVRSAFERALRVRKLGGEAAALAELWFFETAVRVHRAGEGAAYTGLKPAGLPVGPVLPLAEEALETGSAKKLIDFLSGTIAEEVNEKLAHAMEAKKHAGEGVEAAREHVQAMLALELWSHHLYEYVKSREARAEARHGHLPAQEKPAAVHEYSQ